MTEREFLELQNGTDIRGTAIATEDCPVTLTNEAVYEIGKAFCGWLTEKAGISKPNIAIGHDSRLTAKRIEGALVRGITDAGCCAILTGLSTTPAMFMLLKEDFGADASIMITASHLPKEKNGLKFFLPTGGLEKADITAILKLASNCYFEPPKGASQNIVNKPYLKTYAAGLVQKVRAATGKEKPLAGKKILVDAGNGAGGFYADLVLKPLGADTTGSQFLEPDGNFQNHVPNPENREAMRSICEAVKRENADFGIIFDTDVDRAGAVAKGGGELSRNRLIALISAILLEEQKGAYIVTDSVTSDGLAAFITARGGVHHRFKRGYKNVINESIRLNAEGKYSPLAIETSGHAALKENYFLDDGAYLVTRLLIALSGTNGDIMSLIKDLPEAAEETEVRLAFERGCDYRVLGMGAIDDFKRYAEQASHITLAPNNFEGVRVNFDKNHGDGWALLRMSLHEPIMPVNTESNTPGGTKIILKEIYDFLKAYPFLDLTNLEKIYRSIL